MSTATQKPHLLTYYSTGKYTGPISYKNHKPSVAEPGDAALMGDRNKQPHEEINVKAVTQSKFSSRHYRYPLISTP